jgi:hydroxymethylpyrimidine pyrophosphatase-like HAD family hydrolase
MSDLKEHQERVGEIPNQREAETGNQSETLTQKETSFLATYGQSTMLAKRAAQSDRGEEYGALFSDIDNTFYRKDRAETSLELSKQADSLSYPCVAVTGNNFGAIERRIESGELPDFDGIVGAVGNEIWLKQISKDEQGKPVYVKDEEFERLLILGGFDREQIAHKAASMLDQIRDMAPESEFDYQPSTKDAEIKYLAGEKVEVQPFKVSFHFLASSDQEIDNLMKEVSATFPDQKIVMCEEIGYNSKVGEGEPLKYCVDIVAATKADAVNYLTRILEVKRGLVAGDSGNDLNMLLENDINMEGITVGGYKPEVARELDKITVSKSGSGTFRKVIGEDGVPRRMYIEPDQNKNLGPDSIMRAAKIFQRAINIKNIRERREKEASTENIK